MKIHAALRRTLKLTPILMAAIPASVPAQSVTLSQEVDANTFVSSGAPAMNFNGLGAMEIAAPTAAQNRTEETLLGFNTSAIESGFDADFGPGNWAVSSVTLTLLSNVTTAGQHPGNSSFNTIAAGGIELDWLSDNNWNPAQITYNNISGLLPGMGGNTLDSLGDFNYLANGASPVTWTLGLDPNLVNDISGGGTVTIFGQPTAGSTVGYLFNTLFMGGNGAVLNVTATVVPEPSTMAMMASGLAGLAAWRRFRNQK